MKFSSHTHFKRILLSVSLVCTLAFSGIQMAAAADWSSFRGNARNNAVTSARTPRAASEASLKWSAKLKEADDWQTNVSAPLLIDSKVYIVVGNELRIFNKDSGSLDGRVALAAPIDSASRPIADGDTLYIPLNGGRVSAISMSTHEKLWTTPSVETTNSASESVENQLISTPLLSEGKLYIATADADWSGSYGGVIQCIDTTMKTSDSAKRIVWERENSTTGYYWSGAVIINGALVIAGDDGELISLNPNNGSLIDTKSLGEGVKVRSTIVSYKDSAVFTTTDGNLYNVSINENGTLGEAQSVRFCTSSKSSPAIFDNQAYVVGEQGSAGVFRIIDLLTMRITKTSDMPSSSLSSPLLSTAFSNEPIAYFSLNNIPGGIYTASLGQSLKTLFTPKGSQANYCMSSLIADSSGTLYYTNDSGTLFAVKRFVPSNEARIKGVSKTTGSWGSKWSTTRLNPKYTRLTIAASRSSVKLTAQRYSTKSTVYMRTSSGSYKKVNALAVKLRKGKSTSVYIKCVSESKAVTKKYRIIVNRRK